MYRMLKLTGVFALAVMLLAGTLCAQPPDSLWHRAYGDTLSDWCFSVAQMPDGGYMAAGQVQVYYPDSAKVYADIYVVRTDADGDSVWAKTYGGGMSDGSRSITQTSDGNYVITGYTCRSSPNDEDVYVIKIDPDGNLVWERAIGGTRGEEIGFCVREAPDSTLRVVGQTDAYGDEDVLLVGLAADASWAWEYPYDMPGYQSGNELEFTTDGGLIIVGTTSGGSMDVHLIRAESDGDTVWTRTYNFGGNDYGMSVKIVSYYAYIVTGYAEGMVAPNYNAFLMQVGVSGDMHWVEYYGGSGDDFSHSVEVLSDGGFVFTGYTDSYGAGGNDVYLVRTDDNGDDYWTATYGGVNNDAGSEVHATPDGGFIIAGYTSSFGQGFIDLYMVKTEGDPAGVGASVPEGREPVTLLVTPNPSTAEVAIKYDLSHAADVDITIYDLLGRQVCRLDRSSRSPGIHSLTWDGCDPAGHRVSPGVYFCGVTTQERTVGEKLVLLR